jgi:hypothetical protein
VTPELSRNQLEVLEKWLDKAKETLSGRRQREGSSVEQFLAQIFFELQNLATHRRLLDAIRHVPNR